MNRTEITPEQKAILALCARGLTAEQIAEGLQISVHTINTNLKEAYLRLGARNRIHAIAICLRKNLIQDLI